ncbi:MAG: RNA polymerase factor sigma-54 [Alphaproteobacteria bacterium]|nr:RNA polymerase factor sigma-54 [Alphaproteobacteria bacterium]
MALSQRLDLRQAQALVMTPQLQQAIKLLQLSNVELSAFVEQELAENPLLEREESDAERGPEAGMRADPDEAPLPAEDRTAPLAGADPPLAGDDLDSWREAAGHEGEGNLDLAGDPEAWARRGGGEDGAVFASGENGLPQATSLRDHLLQQLSTEIAAPGDRIIAACLIDLLDEAGYLTGTLEAAAEILGCPPERVAAVLALLQRFDPPGVFARNLAECLALQLRERNRLDPAMQTLLDNLPLLAARDAAGLMRLCGVDAADFVEMVAELKALDPKPGLVFDGAPVQPVIPDIIIRRQPDGGWLVELNSETLPRVLVNNRYHASLSRNALGKPEKEYLAERMQSANWLVKSLHQRATTILRVATEIVHQQSAFLDHGVQFLRPLILRDIAGAIGMHESTVSRVTTNKFMATPRGIFELKYFFSSAIPASRGGDAHSAEAVRFRIKALIDREPVSRTLSDEQIVEILQKDGVEIARRTVAKYRDSLRIPSSAQRRREKSMRL